ncbi:MetQ/NlpA family ABC transporter substrate-binding protein [Herbiconiux sp. SYSU D00978]|uniref:MetQ/NlpA family ABC transporter substrate-binding protein n=1 Tax=Herbiconiux sp. SYSU D00978 TaxID=2812562 RepID=UPI001A963D12|nr:MetQ/NlpA family ABC transporter substrate-binding protein [Herbiconiux sp. SYSU D00978]
MSENDGTQRSELRETLEKNSRRNKRWLLAGGGLLAAGALVAGGAAVGGAFSAPAGASAAGAEDELSITIAGSGESALQDAIREVAAEEGLEIEWVNFTDDWVLPNTALVDGEVDANAFQHVAFLSAFNTENDADLTPVLSTVITQWGIFSASVGSLDEIGDGARIAIPDDASNGGRALYILEAAGLLEIADDAGTYPTTDDVVENPRNLELLPIAATTIATQFDDPSLSAVVVGTSYFDPSQGIDKEDALFLDDSLAESSLPYVNTITTRADNVDNPAWDILADVYDDPRVAEALEEDSFGNSVLVDVPAETLQDKLAELEELARELQ